MSGKHDLEKEACEIVENVQASSEGQLFQVGDLVQDLVSTIASLPSKEVQSLKEAQDVLWDESGVIIPFPYAPVEHGDVLRLGFAKPIGAQAQCSPAMIKPLNPQAISEVELILTMPHVLVRQSDHKDYVYFFKRAFYLACVGSGLRKRLPNLIVEFCFQNDIPLQPIITVKTFPDASGSQSSPHFRVNIVCSTLGGFWPIDVLYPWKCNVERRELTLSSAASKALSPTPVYNSILSSENHALEHGGTIETTKTQVDAYVPACVLMAVWLRNRGFSSSVAGGGFGTFEAALILAFLIQGGVGIDAPGWKPISNGVEPLRLFQSLISFLATSDLVHTPAVVNTGTAPKQNARSGRMPAFFDASSWFNVLFKMSSSSYEQLRWQAKMTIECLTQPHLNTIVPTFVLRCCVTWLHFDEVMQYKSDVQDLRIMAQHASVDGSPKGGQGALETDTPLWDRFRCDEIFAVLQTALGDRASLIHVRSESLGTWDPASSGPAVGDSKILIGVVAHPTKATRTIDQGPLANQQPANPFRDFWGSKAELRRFKDGIIRETLVWSRDIDGRSPICQIISSTMSRHFAGFQEIPLEWEDLREDWAAAGDLVSVAFVKLDRLLRSLAMMPLQVRLLRLATPECRLHTPIDQIIETVVQFERSSRWPDDLSAVQRTKTALLLKLGDALDTALSNRRTRLGFDTTGLTWLQSPFLDTQIDDFTFRVRLHHDRETVLVQRLLDLPNSTAQARERARSALRTLKRTYWLGLAHTQAMDAIAARFPVFRAGVRLLRRWCAAHLLSDHIAPELQEIIVAHVFSSPYPHAVPGSPRTAFLRTLSVLSAWNWQYEPLVVNLTSRMTKQDVEAIRLHFEASRKADPAMRRVTLVVGTVMDLGGTAWSNGKIPFVVAARLTALARGTLKMIPNGPLKVTLKALFAPPRNKYDFLIKLRSPFCADPTMAASPSGLRVTTGVALKAAQERFVEELNTRYRDLAVIFYGKTTGVIAGLWSPFQDRRYWKASLDYSTLPTSGSQSRIGQTARADFPTRVNRMALLNEIARLGGNLIISITTKA